MSCNFHGLDRSDRLCQAAGRRSQPVWVNLGSLTASFFVCCLRAILLEFERHLTIQIIVPFFSVINNVYLVCSTSFFLSVSIYHGPTVPLHHCCPCFHPIVLFPRSSRHHRLITMSVRCMSQATLSQGICSDS